MKKIVVTKIINKYEVLLNVGKDDGIDENSKFEIIGKLNEVIDPVTQNSLGTLTYSKVKLKIKRLMPKMCICEDYQNGVQNAYVSKLLNSGMFETRTIKNELNLDIDDYAENQVDKAIYIGDEVLLFEEPHDNESSPNDDQQDTQD